MIEFLLHVRERETGYGGGIERGREGGREREGGGIETANLLVGGNAARGETNCLLPSPEREWEGGRERERGGRVGERERGMEGERERGRDGGRAGEREREGGRAGERERGREGGRQRERGREGRRERESEGE